MWILGLKGLKVIPSMRAKMVLHKVVKFYRRLFMYGREHELAPTRKTSVKFCECEELYLC